RGRHTRSKRDWSSDVCSSDLARLLCPAGIRVKIIERQMKRCEELCELLPKATIIHGDGTNRQLLEEEGIEQTEGFVALTDIDERSEERRVGKQRRAREWTRDG